MLQFLGSETFFKVCNFVVAPETLIDREFLNYYQVKSETYFLLCNFCNYDIVSESFFINYCNIVLLNLV